MGRLHWSSCLDVQRTDGGVTHARALTTTGARAHSQSEANVAVAELRRRLALARGEDPGRADSRALEEALRAAESGDFDPLGQLALEERIAPTELWNRVDELVDQGRIDRQALQRAAPPLKLSWWMKIFVGRKTRELIAAPEAENSDGPR